LTLSEQTLICTRPFEWCEIHPGGNLFLCCPTWLKRPIGNLLDQEIGEIWNGAVAREIRKSVLNHSFHNCNARRCPFLASASGPVGPLGATGDGEPARALESNRSRLGYLPKRLNLCFDLSCNLACPSCRPARRQARGAELDSCRALAERVVALLPEVEEVTLSGFGDPFGSPTYLDLLRAMNRSPQRPALRLHSNAQLWTETLWDTLPNLHRAVREAEISIDAATPRTYEINRPGGTFERLLTNLAHLKKQAFPLTFSMVVQANNYREMPAFVELAEGFGAAAYFSGLVNWGTFARDEYLRRAVHLPGHPRHDDFRTALSRVAAHPGVRVGNLLPCLRPPAS
jgi:MoaA/NifB/PqqE/SkfB family radical SAM enzyme